MTEQPSTVTIVGNSGSYQREYYGVSACRTVLQRLDTWVGQCIQKDDQEAAQGADTAQCPDRGSFESQAQAIKDGATTALDGIWGTFQAEFETKTQVITTLVDNLATEWQKAGGELDTIQGHVQKHIQEDSWSSEGAQQYKAALPTQSKALDEFETLCYRATTVLTSAAAINASVFTSLYQTLIAIEEPIKAKAQTPVKALEYWSESNTSVDNTGCVSYEYYTRSATAKANLEAVNTWLSSFVTTRGEWSTGAQQLADDIPTTQGSVANLKAGGKWPEPKAVVTASANVDSQSWSSGSNQQGTEGTTSNDGVDLNNNGWIFG